MAITFRCEHCHKDVTAPDGAGGRRGKCPYCQQSTYIPAPIADEDILPLAPVDEEDERRQEAEARAAREQDLALIDSGEDGATGPPLEHRDDLTPEDLHHFVVNYCLDMANSNLERAAVHAAKLKGFGSMGRQAVDDLLADEMPDPVLASFPRPLILGFLKQLREEIT